MAVMAADVEDLDGNVVVQAYPDPHAWRGADGERAALRTALGDDLFFDRAAPDRITHAPDFGLRELPSPIRTLIVLADGDTFTVLP
jgi:hypothetical protein